MKGLVILDMDGVIIEGQSQQIFLNYLFREKIVGLFFYLRINLWFIFYKLGFLKNHQTVVDIMKYSFSFLEGKKAAEIEDLVDKFFDGELKEFIFSEMIGIINEHKSRDRELLIISNAPNVIVKKVAQSLGINNYIGTKLEIINGVLTGNISGNIVYGKNKVNLAEDFVENNGLDFKNSWAYADHISDLDLLLFTSIPCAVNPDKLLLEEAQKRNWPILIFKK